MIWCSYIIAIRQLIVTKNMAWLWKDEWRNSRNGPFKEWTGQCITFSKTTHSREMKIIGNLTTGIQFLPLFSLASLSFSEQSSHPVGAPHAWLCNLSMENHHQHHRILPVSCNTAGPNKTALFSIRLSTPQQPWVTNISWVLIFKVPN